MAEEESMAASVDNRPSRLRSALAAVLTLLILVPTGVLFMRAWQDNQDQRDRTQRERRGVEYLTSLSPLISALAEAQSAALQGNSAAPSSLTSAVSRVAAVDQRLGEALGTRERWTGLRDKIGKLPTVTTNQVQIFQAHVEATDLALALFNTVRTNSGLSRDPDNDLSHLQEALGADLPGTVVQVSRMGDLSLMVANTRGSAEQVFLGPQFGAAVQSVNTTVGNLTDNLQAAVDDTDSPTLSSSLVSTVDGFRRGVESFIRGANPGGAPNAAVMATAQSQLQNSLSSLADVLVQEMNGLLSDRLDGLDDRRMEIIAAAAAAVLLALAAVIVPLTGRRRRSAGPPTPGADYGRGMAAGPDTYGNSPLDPAAQYGPEVDPTRRERSGALR
jgi:hypothetical protein